MVHYQVLLCLDTHDTDATAINKLGILLMYKLAAGLSGLFKYKYGVLLRLSSLLTFYQFRMRHVKDLL